jgi:hypothetical protein
MLRIAQTDVPRKTAVTSTIRKVTRKARMKRLMQSSSAASAYAGDLEIGRGAG